MAAELVENIVLLRKGVCAIIKIWNYIVYFYNRRLRKSIKVAVFGDSGVGKSQFLSTITKKQKYETMRTRRNVKSSYRYSIPCSESCNYK